MESSSTESLYCYRNRLTARELRLLAPVASSPFVGRPSFRVVQVPRHYCEDWYPYTAVSYTWGDDEPSEFVRLDGKLFAVRQNLYLLLHALCAFFPHDAQWRFLWVDAICINQADDEERAAQVSLMAETYKNAVNVSVWLGIPRTAQQTDWPCKSAIRYPPTEDQALDWEQDAHDLANRPYWSRYWVIQEFMLAQSVLLYCGLSYRSFWEFRDMLCSGTAIDPDDEDVMKWRRSPESERYTALSLLMNRQHGKHPDFSRPLYDLLIEHCDAKCKEPRDRVFALLGLVRPDERLMLQRLLPDYTMSEDQVLVFTLAHLFKYRPAIEDATLRNGHSGTRQDLFQALGLLADEARRTKLLGQAEVFDYFAGESPHVLKQRLIDADAFQRIYCSGEARDREQLGFLKSLFLPPTFEKRQPCGPGQATERFRGRHRSEFAAELDRYAEQELELGRCSDWDHWLSLADLHLREVLGLVMIGTLTWWLR
ncbi:Heterokaryon incompatibility [Moelleriella libera RCEF 2490]|uniref:Heterokaryon incompatibility n=1 Tax=Moelleriella libera RCEF 2490 TaxID=1081109 RepID=A0A167YSK7_9HYPO|nr:Heterokaryon incompatibility [Moelleriella libera RCEF 2490]